MDMFRILSADAERLLADVAEEYTFKCCDGRTFRSMEELGKGFASMLEETFNTHANPSRNDFSNWFTDIIKDGKLARDLKKSASPAQAAKSVAERVDSLSSKLA
jgi:hypothetical protein